MNELLERVRAHPEWNAAFAPADRVVVESLWRRVERPATTDDDELLEALLELARAVRFEHVALDLTTVAARGRDALLTRGVGSGLVTVAPVTDPVSATTPVIVVTHEGVPVLAYFRRLAQCESDLADRLLTAAAAERPALAGLPEASLSHAATTDGGRRVLAHLARRAITVVTGGPGTGKTTSVGDALRALDGVARERGVTIRTALVAPTAKAAVRLRTAVGAFDESAGGVAIVTTGSVHRLLGLRRDYDVSPTPIELDVVIVDECSMLDLVLMEQVLRRCDVARVVLIGDPDQLASVHVGAALRDVIDAADDDGPLAPLVVELTENFRSTTAIAELARAVHDGDGDAVAQAFATHHEALSLVASRDDLAERFRAWALQLGSLARDGDLVGALDALSRFSVLCATREGPGSVADWRRRAEAWVGAGAHGAHEVVPGTPLLVTRNEGGEDGLSNGVVGVAFDAGVPYAAFPGDPLRTRELDRLPAVEPAWALTIHKSQGSEYDEVVISVADVDVPILTRELLYTAITRARRRVTLIARPGLLAAALARRIDRQSGLGVRLRARGDTALFE